MPAQLTRRHFAGTVIAGAGLAEGDMLATLKRSLPGLGLDLDQEFLKAARVEGEPWWG